MVSPTPIRCRCLVALPPSPLSPANSPWFGCVSVPLPRWCVTVRLPAIVCLRCVCVDGILHRAARRGVRARGEREQRDAAYPSFSLHPTLCTASNPPSHTAQQHDNTSKRAGGKEERREQGHSQARRPVVELHLHPLTHSLCSLVNAAGELSLAFCLLLTRPLTGTDPSLSFYPLV